MEGAKGRATVLVTKDEIEAPEGPEKRPQAPEEGPDVLKTLGWVQNIRRASPRGEVAGGHY